MVGLFAKVPEPGQVKTRLGEDVGMEEAAQFYAGSLEWIILRLEGSDVPYRLFYAPPDGERALLDRYESLCSRNLSAQSGEDLGERMLNALEELHSDYERSMVLIGSDSPDLPLEVLNEVTGKLEQADVVLGPAEDGGYYLIGMNAPKPVLFEGMEWSHPEVLEETLKRAREKGLDWAKVRGWRDYDRLEDLLCLLSTD